MPIIRLRCEGSYTILLEPLEDPGDPSLSTKCCPELAKHLDISLGVDCHRPTCTDLFKSSDKRYTGKASESTAIEITCHDHSMLYWDARDFILSQLAQVFICGDYRAEPCNGPNAITLAWAMDNRVSDSSIVVWCP